MMQITLEIACSVSCRAPTGAELSHIIPSQDTAPALALLNLALMDQDGSLRSLAS